MGEPGDELGDEPSLFPLSSILWTGTTLTLTAVVERALLHAHREVLLLTAFERPLTVEKHHMVSTFR